MPDGVVNLFIQEMEGYAGLFEASVIKAETSSTTYWVACASTIAEDDCPFDATPPFIGMSITQGAKGMQMTHSEEGWSLSQSCTFTTTTASIATCTNYWSVGNRAADRGYYETATSYIRTYDSRLPYTEWWLEQWGRPPLIPVSVTAGAEKLVGSASVSKGSSVTMTAVISESTGGQSSGTGTITPAPAGTQSAEASRTSSSAVASESSNSGAWKDHKISACFVLGTFITVTGVYLL
ncbi:hypothetical protein ACEPPN_012429 [Leptodophora sp. 'Broadleaf-Isolate-01']